MPKPEQYPRETTEHGLIRYLLVTLFVFAVGAFAVAGVAWMLYRFTDTGAEVVLPVSLIYGVTTLVVALGALVGILSRIRPEHKRVRARAP